MDSYGKKCNSRFLLNYGFSVEDNTDPDGKVGGGRWQGGKVAVGGKVARWQGGW
jgi:hypothetical protein